MKCDRFYDVRLYVPHIARKGDGYNCNVGSDRKFGPGLNGFVRSSHRQ